MAGCLPAADDRRMDVYTFSIGKADCSLLSFDGMNVLIDAGEKGDADEITEALQRLQVEQLDLVILTHFDKDHIGGFSKLCNRTKVKAVLMPDYVRDSEYYAAMEDAIQRHNIPVQRVSGDVGMTLQNAAFTIWSSTQTYDAEKGNDNELSLVTAVTYGQVRLLFLADAEGKWLNDLCYKGYELGCDVMKFPCHGKWQKDIPALLALSMPGYAIVTDSEKNPAAIKTLDALKTLDAKIFRTADGDIHLVTDGKKVTVP